MPHRRTRWLLAASLMLMIVGLSSFTARKLLFAAEPGPRAEQWKKVEQAENKGLPKSAIAELEPIIASALRDKAYPEAIKAISKKIALEGIIQGNHPEERITRLEAEIAQAPAEMQPMMRAILANWYWHYFQHNRWRYLQRTQTAAADGTDIKTWSLPRVFQEIDKQFSLALANEKVLKSTPVSAYAALLQQGTVSDAYRPTLWDFLVFDALEFYSSSEQAAAQPEDAWEPEAGGPILATLGDFLKWNPNTSDTTSRKLKAVRLYQNLLAFHQNDQDRTAKLDADLHRLQFGYNAAFGPEKSGRYKAALQDFIAKWGDHELSAVARFRFATLLNEEGEKVEAKKQAEEGVKAFPESHGGLLCFNLIQQIQAPSVELMTERVWADPLPPVRVKYRNITSLHFRAYKADWVQRIGQQQWRPEQLNEADREAMLAQAPDHAWTATLPATTDYQERVADTPAPQNLKPGFYFLFASPDADFQPKKQPIFTTDFWVSNLAIVLRNREGGRGIEGFVLNARTGEPVAGAKMQGWTRSRQGKYGPAAQGTTDDNGLFTFPGGQNQTWLIFAEHDGQSLGSGNDLYSYWNGQSRPYNQAVLFTDRVIYRPGQTVRFKGIILHVNQDKDDYKTLANQSVDVEFLDPNGKSIDKIQAQSNDFGSFSGSFTAPRDRLSGAMSLRVRGSASGYARVQVEEYKRPQFLVTLDDPKTPAKLGGDVTLTGKATAYTGVAIGGAKVRYRVVRRVQFAPWIYQFCWWRIPPNPGQSQEIAHGHALTNADGSFPITFTAKPDQTVAAKDEPTFTYTVTADVTDTTGETRTGSQSVTVGYTALAVTVSTPDWLTTGEPQKLTVTTNTHDGVPQAVKGVVKVYAVQQPAKVMRPDILNQPNHRPWRGRMGKPPAEEPKPDPTNPLSWAEGAIAATLPFTTQKDGTVTLTAKLPVGLYRAVVETQDAFGKPVSTKSQFMVVDPTAKQFGIRIPNLVAAPRWTLEPGETFSGIWGTGYDKGRAYVEIEHRGEILKSFWTDANRTEATITHPVTEAMRGGFTVRTTYVRENRAYLESRIVQVPWTNKQLQVKWERFVSKLEPGAKEKWTAIITGPDAKTAVAEMVATLYDESLDQYQKHSWPSQFSVFRHERSPRFSHFENMAKQLFHASGQWENHAKSVPSVAYRAFPADVTDNLWGYRYLRKSATRGDMAQAPGAPAPAMAFAAMGGRGEAKGQAMEKDKQANNNADADARAADSPKPNLDQVAARTNLAETAFFFPTWCRMRKVSSAWNSPCRKP